MPPYFPLNKSAVNFNVTIDDLIPVLNYTNPYDWQTPDPQSSALAAASTTNPWLEGTWHKTTVVNASVILNFEGPAIYIFGASGPQYGSYAVTVDDVQWTYSAHSATNASNPHLLYGNPNLSYGTHQLTIRNLGAAHPSDEGASALLLDYILTTIQLAPPGATVTNTTVDANHPAVTYTGGWTNKSNEDSRNGTSFHTEKHGGSASISFKGSAVYIFGDSVNDQGPYSVVLDNGPIQTYGSLGGGEGGSGRFYMKTQPTLKYFASNLDSSQHTITVTSNVSSTGLSFSE
ncbi:hypothetical protein FRB96_004372 [Tulasnella sp. 330]|nr:hypothetical protein FRB96_004372 [Tulasnella sp. 330]